MRKFIGGVVLLGVLLGVLVAVAASNLDAYLNDNKDWVAEQVESALLRPVAFDEVGLSFSSGFGVKVSGFRVGEDADYGEGDFLSVGEAEVRVAIWPALFGRVEVTKISLHDLSVTVIQDIFGTSTDSLGGTSDPNAPAPAKGPSDPSADEGGSALASFVVGLAEIRSGHLRYVDRTSDPDREVVIDQLEFWTTDVGLTRPLQFQLLGELLGEEEEPNLSVHGSFGPLPSMDGVPTPLDIQFSLDPVRMDELRAIPGLADAIDPDLAIEGTMKLSGRLSGHVETPKVELDLDATDALVSWAEDGHKARGVPLGVAFDIGLVDRDVAIHSADLEFEAIKLHAKGKVANLDDPTVDLLIDIFSGTIEVEGGWTSDGALALDARIQSVELGEMTRSLASQEMQVFDGRLDMSLAVTGQGTSWEELKPGLEGRGSATIDDGVLHDVNLIEEALVGFTGIPGLSSKLPEKLAKKYPALFSSGNTEFDHMEGQVEVREGRVHILGIEVDMPDFAVRGEGSVSLDGDLDMSTRLMLSRAISKDLVGEAKPLKHLRDKRDRIQVPILITGRLPDVSAKPDTDKIAKKLGSGAAEGLADEALDKAFDKSIGRFVQKNKKKKKKKKKRAKAETFEETPADVDEDGRDLLEDLLK